MHLTDEQLLELDEHSTEHLISCEACKTRFKNLANTRRVLAESINHETTISQWKTIKNIAKAKQQSDELKLIRRYKNKWRIINFGLAASLIITFYWTFDIAQNSVNADIDSLIAENKQLQQRLTNLTTISKLRNAEYQILRQNIVNLDIQIQQAYLYDTDKLFKKALWNKRKKIVQEILLLNTKPNEFRI